MAVLTLSLYKSLERENGVGLMAQSGWRWADVHQLLSTAELRSRYIPSKHSLNIVQDVSGRWSYMICTCLLVWACLDCHQSRVALPGTGEGHSLHRNSPHLAVEPLTFC